MGKNKRVLLLLCALLAPSLIFFHSALAKTKTSYWSTGYYLGQNLNSPVQGTLKPKDIDYTALSHIIFYGIIVHFDGSLDLTKNNVESDDTKDLISRAHKAGVKVLVSTGGLNIDGHPNSFREAASGAHLQTLLDNLENVILSLGFDGIDIDWEPISINDYPDYSQFVIKLRDRLDRLALKTNNMKRLMTAAVIDAPELMNTLQSYFDQINLMTYDLAGVWVGALWHNSPLYGQGLREDGFHFGRRFLNSVDSEVRKFTDAGVNPKKLGVGLEFYGYSWEDGEDAQGNPVILPKGEWAVEPKVDEGLPYSTIMKTYFKKEFYKWDSHAKVPYLSIPDFDGDPIFISYENERSCTEKAKYVKDHGLGGLMIWELSGGWVPESSPPDGLLKSIKKALK